MKKKILLGLLVLTLVILPLSAACSSPGSTSAPATSAAQTSAPQSEVINLKFAIILPDSPTGCNHSRHLLDYIEEKANGRVKIERYWNGVLGAPPEMLNLISTRAIDITLLMAPLFTEQLPFHNFPEYQMGGAAKTMDYINKLNFEIPETAALMESELKANNIKGLNWFYVGEEGIMARTVFSSLDDLKGKKLGTMKPNRALSALGINEVSVLESDSYEALSRGVCDCVNYNLTATVLNKWYEVTKCYMFNGFFHGGWQTIMNLDTWNSLPADIQQIIIDAAKDTETYSVECEKAATADQMQLLKDKGLVIGQLPAADTENWFKINYDLNVQDLRDIAAKVGKTADMEVLLKNVDSLTWSK